MFLAWCLYIFRIGLVDFSKLIFAFIPIMKQSRTKADKIGEAKSALQTKKKANNEI